MLRTALMVVLVGVLGCGKGDQAKAEQAGNEFMAKMITDDLPAIRAAVTSANPDSASLKCAQVQNLEEARKGGKLLEQLAEYEKLCTLDLPLATLKSRVEKTEAARAAKPDEKVLSECFDAYYDLALKELEKHKHADVAKAYVARFAAACPDAKK